MLSLVPLTQEYLIARNTYFLAIKNAKRTHWNNFLENEDTKTIFKAASYTKNSQVEKLPAIQAGDGTLKELFVCLFVCLFLLTSFTSQWL